MSFLPIRGSVARFLDAPAAVTILAAMILVTAVQLAVPSLHVVDRLGISSSLLRDGELWRLFTWSFPQAVGLPHLILNGLAVYLYGPYLEHVLTSWKFVVIFFLCAAFGGAWGYFVLPPYTTVSAGASQAAFGIFGALLGFSCMLSLESPVGRPSLVRVALIVCALLALMVPLGVVGELFLGHGFHISSLYSYITGHSPGFVCGVVLGLAFAQRGPTWTRWLMIPAIAAVLAVTLAITLVKTHELASPPRLTARQP